MLAGLAGQKKKHEMLYENQMSRGRRMRCCIKIGNEKMNMNVAASSRELMQEAAELFVNNARGAIKASGRFCAAISRHTAKPFLEELAADSTAKPLPWSKIQLFCVDECFGTSDTEDNGYKATMSTLGREVGMPADNIHHIGSKLRSCELLASFYEHTIRNVVGCGRSKVPRFDLIMLRMEPDGHIASLFPDAFIFYECERLVGTSYFMDSRRTRITVTHPILFAASHIAVLVSGREMAPILGEVFTQPYDIARYPIHALWPVLTKMTWLVNGDAAKCLLPPCTTKYGDAA
jgi:6-phosphogluconolactonase